MFMIFPVTVLFSSNFSFIYTGICIEYSLFLCLLKPLAEVLFSSNVSLIYIGISACLMLCFRHHEFYIDWILFVC